MTLPIFDRYACALAIKSVSGCITYHEQSQYAHGCVILLSFVLLLHFLLSCSYRRHLPHRRLSKHSFSACISSSSIPDEYSVESEWIVGKETAFVQIHKSVQLFYESINRCCSLSEGKKKVRRGQVWVNHIKANNQYTVNPSDIVRIVYRSTPRESKISAAYRTEEKKVQVLYEDDHCAVVNKPHPDLCNPTTILNL